MKMSELIELLVKDGFNMVATYGHHAKFENGKRVVILPAADYEIPSSLLERVLKQTGIK
ncbi:type II toxin-antitoxin system HicA family toxin [Lactiplantibacillus pentosus]|uniref:type II toxin-antitoxin system HicA family toxin n=1 Tax=Lactiplantibacillus pentosus TaxID=1589 RepID=UPI003D7AF42B